MSNKTLKLYDPSLCTKVTAESSSYGLGAVLSQKSEDGTWHPVTNASRSLSSTEKRYAQVEKEVLASAWACNRFEDYLIGFKFLLETDHQPPVALLGTKSQDELPARIQRMRMRLMRFSYLVVHVPGRELYPADTLSWAPGKMHFSDNGNVKPHFFSLNYLFNILPILLLSQKGRRGVMQPSWSCRDRFNSLCECCKRQLSLYRKGATSGSLS